MKHRVEMGEKKTTELQYKHKQNCLLGIYVITKNRRSFSNLN